MISVICLTTLLLAKGRRLPLSLRHIWFYLVCGFLGTAIPNTLSYTAYQHLPIGVNLIIISLVPMLTILMSIPLRLEKLDFGRLFGITLGVIAIILIAAPDTSLPEPGKAVWVILPVLVAISYSGENVFIAKQRPSDCDELAIMCGLSWGALCLLTPVLIFSETYVDLTRFGPPEKAIIATALLHTVAYFGFIWLIDKGGPIFASQVAYIVTGSGVVLGIAIYGESHSPWVWAALFLMFIGLALVKPRQ